MNWRRSAAISSLLMLLISPAFAGAAHATQGARDSNFELLSQSEMWLQLLHYEKRSVFAKTKQSAISSASFFLSPEGGNDPYLELVATIDALSFEVGQDSDKHARCRFPARYIWLKKQLAHRSDVSLNSSNSPKCDAYDDWSQHGEIASISVVLATGYLGNPASYFGHSLLKFNSKRDSTRSELLDNSVNFGALIPQGENPAVYLAKGMFGGYDSNFTHKQYYYHDHNYTELESRDLWEYELDLSKGELELIVAHSWELIGQNYTYFFFRKNCAYRMAEVLNLVDGVQIIPENRGWTIPQSVVRKLYSTKRGAKSLVSEVRHHPSRLSEFHSEYQQLEPSEQRLLKRIAESEEVLESEKFLQLPALSQARVLDGLLKYLYYQKKNEDSEIQPARALYKQVLVARFRRPEKGSEVQSELLTHEKINKLGRSEFNVVHNSELGAGVLINIRPAYYDALDAGQKQSAHSALSVLEFEGIHFDGSLALRKLEIVSIESVGPSVSGLRGDTGATWALRAGYETPSLECYRCSRFRVEASKGKSWHFSESGIFALEFGGVISDNRHGYGNASVYLRLFANQYINDKWSARWSVSNKFFLDSPYSDRVLLNFESRRVVAENIDLRFKVRKNQAIETSVSLGYYW